nr:hypothetical protein [Dickeya solani]
MALGGDEVETIPLSAYRWVNQDLNLPIDPNQPQEATMIYVAPSEKQTMESMNLLASIVKTRQVDDSGSVSYFTLPERVPGTNDYKVDVAELMKEKDPGRYQAYLGALESGGDWFTPYLDFVKQFPQHPEWMREYQANAEKLFQSIAGDQITHRFASADLSSSATLISDVRDTLLMSYDEQTVQTHIKALRRFVDVLEGSLR